MLEYAIHARRAQPTSRDFIAENIISPAIVCAGIFLCAVDIYFFRRYGLSVMGCDVFLPFVARASRQEIPFCGARARAVCVRVVDVVSSRGLCMWMMYVSQVCMRLCEM